MEERQVHDLVIRIERDLCVGFADCIEAAADAFVLGEDGIVAFRKPDDVARDVLLEACDVCPVDALTVWDSSGAQIVPS